MSLAYCLPKQSNSKNLNTSMRSKLSTPIGQSYEDSHDTHYN